MRKDIYKLPSRRNVLIKIREIEFKKYLGKKPGKGGIYFPNFKPLVLYKNKPFYPEIAVIKLQENIGWSAVWIDSFRRKYWRSMTDKSTGVQLPAKQLEKIENIHKKSGIKGGCWDVVAWKGNRIKFIELKHEKHDHIHKNQLIFLSASLKLGHSINSFEIVEWFYQPSTKIK